jgi:DNA-binding protein HU-beta
MNRRDLVKLIAAHTELDPREVDKVLKGTTEVITAVVAKGEPVTIPGFAKFAKVERAARMARNPATGEPVKVKASKKARITPLKGFKDSVMTPSQAPKLARGLLTHVGNGRGPVTAKKAAAPAATAKKAPAKATAARTTTAKAVAKKAPARKAPARKAAATR